MIRNSSWAPQYRGAAPARKNAIGLRQKRRSWWQRFRQYIDNIKNVLEPLAALAVIGGIPFFFIQDYSNRHIIQVQSALQFVAIHNGDMYFELRGKLEQIWSEVNVNDFKDKKHAEIIAAKRKIWADSNLPLSDLSRMTDFYNAVLQCRALETCDAKTIDAMFHDDIVGFYCIHREILEDISYNFDRPNYLSMIHEYSKTCDFIH